MVKAGCVALSLVLSLLAYLAAAQEVDEYACDMTFCTDLGQCVYTEKYLTPCDDTEVMYDRGAACGCCPACVTRIGASGYCSEDSGVPCKKGYRCKDGTCKIGPCTVMEEEMKTEKEPFIHGQWTPLCADDGSYAPVQCKGEQKGTGDKNVRCFCWSPEGDRLYGEASSSKDMNCGCSLRAWELKKDGKGHRAPHCTENGDFEQLQCDDGLCWCANTTSGAPIKNVVPETAITLLTCYSSDGTGSQFRRQCDSQIYAQEILVLKRKTHGSETYNDLPINCDLDGNYGPVQWESSTNVYCATKDKKIIGDFRTEFDFISPIMDCKCARDFATLGESKEKCETWGNYKVELSATSGGNTEKKYCVDEDGFPMHEKPEGYICIRLNYTDPANTS